MATSRARVKESFMSRLFSSIRAGFKEVWSNNMGKIGLSIIVVIIGISIYAVATLPPDLPDRWNYQFAWSEYPKRVPPEWIKYFGVPIAKHEVYEDIKPKSYIIKNPQQSEVMLKYYYESIGKKSQILYGYIQEYKVEYKLEQEAFPTGLQVFITPKNQSYITYRGQNITIQAIPIILIERPDGLIIEAYEAPTGFKLNELSAITADPLTFGRELMNYYREKGIESNLTDIDLKSLGIKLAFGEYLGGKHVKPLTGTYTIYLLIMYTGAPPNVIENAIRSGELGIEKLSIVVMGSAYGLFGTDVMGRDLALGIFYGFPVAVVIGLFAAVSSVLIGLVIGVISGYYGGLIDEIIQRIIDILANIPLLPILILVGVAIQENPNYGPWSKLFIIIGFLVILGWGGLAIIVRSMTLSIKAEPYIEAARAIGASNRRIIFRHIIPQIIPYAMASLVFSVPGAIIIEAGLSVLGIEHGLPTWGKILADAQANRGVAYTMWWWILPPGLMLAITSLAFVLLGLAIETIVEPRLRR
ncbi:MAG: ABC transporter permease [Desulfurococcales archaeon]|nr:ABC transporter permease [Desulfurococcales archaeon]